MTPPEILVAIAGHGLNPSLRRVLETPLVPGAWRTLAGRIDECRLSAFAIAASRAGTFPVTEEQEDQLRRQSTESDRRCLAAAACLDEIVGELDRHSVESCVLHEAAVSVLDYPPSLRRPFETVDLLVGPRHHDVAVRLLRDAGLLRAPQPERRPAWRRRRTERYVSASGVDTGVHSSLTPGRFGTGSAEAGDLFVSRIPFSPRATKLRALGPEERLVGACIHARLDRPAGDLLAQRDVVQLVLRDDLSLRKVERLAASWRVEAVLADAVRRAWDTFEVPDVVPISAWSRAYRPHRRDRRRLAAHPVPSWLPGGGELDPGSGRIGGQPVWGSGS